MRLHVLALAAALTVSSAAPPAQKGGEDETGPYLVVDNWVKPFARPGYIQGSQGGVFAESANRIFVLNRGELKLPDVLPATFNGSWGSLGQQATLATPELRNCILVLDGSGKRHRVVDAMGQAVPGRARPAPRQDQSLRSGTPRLGCRRQPAPGVRVHQRRQGVGADAWRGRRAGERRSALRAADRHRVSSRRNVLRQRRLHQYACGQVRQTAASS